MRNIIIKVPIITTLVNFRASLAFLAANSLLRLDFAMLIGFIYMTKIDKKEEKKEKIEEEILKKTIKRTS